MPRQDIFTFIHKGIRAMIYDQGRKLMQTDFTDPDSIKNSLDELNFAFKKLEDHGKIEENHVFPALKDNAPLLVEDFIGQHKTIHEKLSEAKTLILKLQDIKSTEQMIQSGIDFCRCYNNIAASYLEHMNREETEMLPATWEYLTDEKLGEIVNNIQRTVTPKEFTEQLTWSIGAANNPELIGILKDMKANAPSAVMDNVMGIAAGVLPPDRLEYIRNAVENN